MARIGCFALLSFSVSLHVAVSHGGRPERLAGHPWQVVALGMPLFSATAFRVMASLDPDHLERWLGCAAACLLMATGAWAALVLPTARAAGSRHP
jgi:protein-S-isoprenylcysteine O-methyltransferase Ste14